MLSVQGIYINFIYEKTNMFDRSILKETKTNIEVDISYISRYKEY